VKPDVATHEGARHLTLQFGDRAEAHATVHATEALFPFAGKASRSPGTFRQEIARSRCDRLPGRPTPPATIYRCGKAWRPSRAWHRSKGGNALDGRAPVIFTDSTTSFQRVVPTGRLLEEARTAVRKKLQGFLPCGVSQTIGVL